MGVHQARIPLSRFHNSRAAPREVAYDSQWSAVTSEGLDMNPCLHEILKDTSKDVTKEPRPYEEEEPMVIKACTQNNCFV